MSRPVRGALSSLTSRLAPKAANLAAQEPEQVERAEFRGPQKQAPTQRDLKTMMCRVNRVGWQEMSRLAIDTGENLEDLLIEACNDLLRKNDRPPVIEKRSPNPRT